MNAWRTAQGRPTAPALYTIERSTSLQEHSDNNLVTPKMGLPTAVPIFSDSNSATSPLPRNHSGACA
eukprot:5700182-Amphidinium_carterae.1